MRYDPVFFPLDTPAVTPTFQDNHTTETERSYDNMTKRRFDPRSQMACFLNKRSLRSMEDSAFISGAEEKPSFDMDRAILDQILLDIGSKKPEQGGALGVDKTSGRITRFYFDEQANRSSAAYSPDARTVTEVINQWDEEGVAFCGMIHSHPGSFGSPSEGDRQYAAEIINAMPETLQGKMLMPIVTVNLKKQQAWLHPFIAMRNDNGDTVLFRATLTVDGEPIEGALDIPSAESLTDDAGSEPPQEADSSPASSEVPETPIPAKVLFQRNARLLPLEELSQRTVVIIGCGGARGFCESLTRSAVGRFILVDGDRVSETNVATQGTYVDEIGLYKTEVIANTLRRINPHIQITEVHRFLDDGFSDDELASYIGEELLAQHPERVLLCGCTDNFPAQDRTVKLALKWGVPYLASQTYAEGRGGEVIFNYPGITTTCPRCMLASRYAAYEQNANNDVTSEGAPIYSTERLNALKSHIAMMLLLYGTSSRLGSELDKVKDRNLVLVSFTADCEEKLGISAFSRTLSALDAGARATLPMEETVWLEQKPDRPENGYPHCPYCGGVGDLRLLRGLNADTRKPYNLTAFIHAVQPKGE